MQPRIDTPRENRRPGEDQLRWKRCLYCLSLLTGFVFSTANLQADN